MASIKLAIIAHRQRSYLLRDLIVAVLMVLLVAVQVSAFTTSGGAAGTAQGDPPALTRTEASGAAQAQERSAAVTSEACTDPWVC
jgi:hypothetical protein